MRIFRFEKNEAHRLEAIKRQEIYLSCPENFNDLDDCRIQGISSLAHDVHLHEKISNCVDILYPKNEDGHFPLPSNILNSLKEIIENFPSSDGSFDNELRRSLYRNYNVMQIRSFLRENTGVCCFFKDQPKHPLMWAHYANSHTGFCVEYEIEEISSPFYEVNYTSRLPSPSINELLFCPAESFIRILTTKALEWSYEKEIRFLLLNALSSGESGKLVSLPSIIRPVRLIKGAKFDNAENRELIQSLDLETVFYKSM